MPLRKGFARRSRILLAHGRMGPLPAPVASIASAITARSLLSSASVDESIQPSTCAVLRASTIAPLTPGHARVQATATAATVVLWRAAIGVSACANSRFR